MDNKKIKNNTKYRIKGNSKYFKDKYRTSNPIIEIEGEHQSIFSSWWGYQKGNIGCMLYGMRSAIEKLPMDKKDSKEVFYGKINGFGELVHISELEEL